MRFVINLHFSVHKIPFKGQIAEDMISYRNEKISNACKMHRKEKKMKKSRRKKKEAWENFLYTIPALILVGMMMYIPFVMSGYYSLTRWNGIAKTPEFIGFENFKTIFTGGSDFLPALWFTVKYTALFMIFSNILALALAVVLTKKFKLANLFRGIFFVPYIMSMTIVGFIWKFIFTSGFKALYQATGWEFWNASWLGDPNLVFYSIVLVGAWQSLGFYRLRLPMWTAQIRGRPSSRSRSRSLDHR